MIVFLDTEFTDLGPKGELLSMGLVQEDGERSLYLERSDFDPATCSEFVQSVVLPLLGRQPAACCRFDEFGDRVRSWLAAVPGKVVTIGIDFEMDWDFLVDVLHPDWPENVIAKPLHLRVWLSAPGFAAAEEAYFADGYPRHHALNDAQAARAGYLAAKALDKPFIRPPYRGPGRESS